VKKLFSIVIPVRDDYRILSLMEELERLMDFDLGEVIIVLNGCSEVFLRRIREEIQKKQFGLIRLKVGNISSARNAGIAAALGEWIVFIDSDCRIEDDYVRQLVAFVSTTESQVVRGAVTFNSGHTYFSRNQARLKQKAYAPESEHFFTPNLIVRRGVFCRVGGFDPRLSGVEDGEWSERVKAYGAMFEFASDLKIAHAPDHSSGCIRKWIRYGYGSGVRLHMKCRDSGDKGKRRLIMSHLIKCYRYRFRADLRWVDVPFMVVNMVLEIGVGLPVGFLCGAGRRRVTPVERTVDKAIEALLGPFLSNQQYEVIISDLGGGDL
jgi:glycosyltransferase involved in cell wall biosynthesis